MNIYSGTGYALSHHSRKPRHFEVGACIGSLEEDRFLIPARRSERPDN